MPRKKKLRKAGYFTDTHFKRQNPQSRIDVYWEAILKKLMWIIIHFARIKTDLIFDGGDFFDKSTQSPWEIRQVYEVLKGSHTTIHTVAGNHPIKGNVEKWIPYSGLYLLEEMLDGKYQIHDGFKADVEDDGVTFRLHHTDLVKKPVLWDHILWEDYDAEDADVVLVSHYHPQQGVWQRDDGVWFVSPGAVSRGSLGEDNVERVPAVAVIEYGEGKVHNIELVDIPCARGEHVLNLSTVTKVVDIEKDMVEFDECIETLREMVESNETALAPEEILKVLGKRHKVGGMVLDYCLEKIEELRG